MVKHTCPCCGYKTLESKPPGTYEICPVCFWEEDGISTDNPYYIGGANRISLIKAQQNFVVIKACELRALPYVRPPLSDEVKDSLWRIIEDTRQKPPKEVIINLSNISAPNTLQIALRQSLLIPDSYSLNWDQLYHAVTEIVPLPEKLVFKGWNVLEKSLPKEAQALRELFEYFNEAFPPEALEIEYQ